MTQRFPIYQVDAFADRPFTGNPAAVVPLDSWLPDPVLQAIAAENNLSETAYLVPDGEGWLLRWFTPGVEVDLCGHATLASAYVVSRFLRPGATRMDFRTLKAGVLTVTRDGDRFDLDLPARPPQPFAAPAALTDGLRGPEPQEILAARDFLVVYETEAQVRALAPEFLTLATLDRMVIVTAPGTETDFVSRFFAPGKGIAEDPVTGSAHCTLVPYWATRLGRTRLSAFQASARGGHLDCRLDGDRVVLGGGAVLYLEGSILV